MLLFVKNDYIVEYINDLRGDVGITHTLHAISDDDDVPPTPLAKPIKSDDDPESNN